MRWLVRLLAARRLRRVAVAGRPWQVRVAWWLFVRVVGRAWRRLDPAEQRELRRLVWQGRGRRGRLGEADRAELTRLLGKLRGREPGGGA